MKLNYRCPLCGGLIFNVEWKNVQENCSLVCPSRQGKNPDFCNILCYFYCSEKDVTISYIKILEMINYPKIQDWDEDCEGYIKIYEKIFEGCCSLILSDKGYEF